MKKLLLLAAIAGGVYYLRKNPQVWSDIKGAANDALDQLKEKSGMGQKTGTANNNTNTADAL